MAKNYKNWIQFIAVNLIALAGGFNYCLSVFQIPLSQEFGWGIPEIAFAYSILSGVEVFVVFTIISRVRKFLGIRRFMILGGLFLGGGVLCCAFMQGFIWELYIFQGVMIGIGNAILVPGLTSYAVQLLPDKAGLASGIVVAVYSTGTLVWAPLLGYTINLTDVLTACKIMGIILMVVIILPSMILPQFETEADDSSEEEEEKEKEKERNRDKKVKNKVYNVGRWQMLKLPLFYLFYLTYYIGILSGTMMLTQGATILEKGLLLSATGAATALGVLSVGNTAGRLITGVFFDSVNKFNVIKVMFVLYVISFTGMAVFYNSPYLFLGIALFSFFSFGGFVATLAPMTAKLFGVNKLKDNFTFVFTLYSMSGFVAPIVVTQIREVTESYLYVFTFGIVINVIGFVMANLLEKKVNIITEGSEL